MAIINVKSKSELNELLGKKDQKVLVDFFATWCGPCRMLGELLHQISDENPDMVIAKINVDENMDLAREYNISSIPHMFVFENGKAIDDILGYVEKNRVLKAFN